MIEKGSLLLCETKTKNDVFGTVLWEVVAVGLTIPDPAGPKGKTRQDGIHCRMLAGSGPSARPGYPVFDTLEKVNRDIASGVTKVVPASERDSIVARWKKTERPATGVIEM